jgi:HD superfamily phosphohydrolase YqeK
MEEWVNISIGWLNSYIGSFKGLTINQQDNFEIKREHSVRVANISLYLAKKLELSEEQSQIAYLIGVFHDTGRFSQVAEYDTFSDDKSVDHGDLAVKILQEESFFDKMDLTNKNLILTAVQNHNKYKLNDGLTEEEALYSKLIRDADKLDILKVLTDYYSNPKTKPNHTLTWDLPKGSVVSAAVAKEVLSGKMVSKKNLVSEIDAKIMQMSWVYDLNFRPSIELLIKNRFLEIIYNTLPKNDLIIDIHRKIKVFSENKILVK